MIAHDLCEAALVVEACEAPNAPPEGLTLDGAYRVQALVGAMAVGLGSRRCGYKVALSSSGAQRALGATEPAFGILFDRMAIDDGGRMDRGARIRPLIESEVAVLVGRDLAGSPDVPSARRAVAGVRPAIEVADTRVRGRLTAADCVADNASGGAFVLGGPEWIAVDGIDLAGVAVTLECPWCDPVHGSGDAVLGDPLAALAWLAQALTQRTGQGLRAGDVVMTGSLHPPVPVGGPGRVEARFTGLGVASLVVV